MGSNGVFLARDAVGLGELFQKRFVHGDSIASPLAAH